MNGLGIGAFVYYRRIIEDQKNRLLDAVLKVAKHQNATADIIQKLEAAKTETQFKKAVESVKDAIPKALHIRGRNPLTLLHAATSKNIHTATDEDCLQIASDIRLILVEFAERLSAAMEDGKELDDAVARLLSLNSDDKGATAKAGE